MPNWSQIGSGAATGALGGAATGASIGSVVPIFGTALGGLIGAGAGALLGGTAGGLANRDQQSERYKQLQQLTPLQQNIANKTGQMGLQKMQDPYAGWEPLKKQAMDFYNQELVPDLTNRFTAGSGGARLSSPAFGSQLAAGGQGLAAMLNAQRMAYGQQQQQFGLDQAKFGQGQQFENIHESGGPEGFSNQLMGLLGEYATKGGGFEDLLGKLKDHFSKGTTPTKTEDPTGLMSRMTSLMKRMNPTQRSSFLERLGQGYKNIAFNQIGKDYPAFQAAQQKAQGFTNPSVDAVRNSLNITPSSSGRPTNIPNTPSLLQQQQPIAGLPQRQGMMNLLPQRQPLIPQRF